MSCSRNWSEELAVAITDSQSSDMPDHIAQHLRQCSACQAEWQELERTASQIRLGLPERPTPGQLDAWGVIGSEVSRASSKQPTESKWNWKWQAASGFALLVIGVSLGLQLQAPSWSVDDLNAAAPASTESSPYTVAHQNIATDQYVKFLEDATPLLLAVANRNSANVVMNVEYGEYRDEQLIAASLADYAASLMVDLKSAGRNREARLVDSLQMVFLQMANIPPEHYSTSLDLVQSTIEQRGILFQLTVEEIRRVEPSKPKRNLSAGSV